jgi:hypothetical protein
MKELATLLSIIIINDYYQVSVISDRQFNETEPPTLTLTPQKSRWRIQLAQNLQSE